MRAGHGHGGKDEPLQRLALCRQVLLAAVHRPQFDRRRCRAQQRDWLVVQHRLGESRVVPETCVNHNDAWAW